MLDVIYYPVSAILWFWHQVFGAVIDPAGGISWALSVAFLVFTLRAVLVGPFLGQARAQRAARRLAPQLAVLKNKYAGDRQALTAATAALHREHGVNPLLGCLPALVQAPVIFGLYHVLNSFNRTGAPLWLTAQQNAQTANYLFAPADVQSFLEARLFGAPLAASINSSPSQLAIYGANITTMDVALVAIPMMIIAAVATHFTARASIRQQQLSTDPQAGQAKVLNVLMLWVFPLGVLIGGAFLPVAILVYWLANNAWTLAQQLVFQHILDRQDAALAAKANARRRQFRGPLPGARPQRSKRRTGPPKNPDAGLVE